jgi:pimeloyl-ACP methyl ester carboxylesterase
MTWLVRLCLLAVLLVSASAGSGTIDGAQQGAWGETSCTDPGRALPVVVVHGFLSSSDAMSDLVATLEDTAIDVAVETFDYRDHHSRWVTHPQIGPRLRQHLLCLADASMAAGGLGRVVVVGHSMGGLATRYALSTDDGDGRGVLVDEIALVATIGTPHEGSVWGVAAGQAERGLRSSLTTQMWGQPQPLAGTPAGGALAIGSSQLAQLPDFPVDVPVLALASEYIGQPRFLFYRTPEVRVGDAVVSRSSATAQSREIGRIGGSDDITCRINLPLERGPASIAAAVAAELLANPAVKDCGHIWQHRARRLTGEIGAHIAAASNQPPRTKPHDTSRLAPSDLLAAPVPSLCRHPAGSLEGGRLPGIPEGDGGVELAVDVEALRRDDNSGDLIAQGDISGDGRDEIAVVVSCNRGGVRWPDSVLVYGAGPELLGVFEPWEHVDDWNSRGSVGLVDYIENRGAVLVKWLTHREGDFASGGSLPASAVLRLDRDELSIESLETYEELPLVRQVLAAAEAGDRNTLTRLVPESYHTDLLLLMGATGWDGDPECSGMTEYSQHSQALRICRATVNDGASAVFLSLDLVSFGHWEIVEVTGAG